MSNEEDRDNSDSSISVVNKAQKLFLSCSSLNLINWKNILKLIQDQSDPLALQVSLLESTVLHPLNVQFPVKKEYQRIFIKQWITQLESSGEEIDDKVYECYVESLNSNSEQRAYFYRHFKIDIDKFITVQEKIQFVSDGTTGLSTWEGGLALAEWCIQQGRPLVKGRRVLELGCGLGLTGLAVCAVCQPVSYTFTDCHPGVLQALQQNLDINQSLLQETRTAKQLLDWEEPATGSLLDEQPDLILAADVVYDKRLFTSLINTLRHLLKKPTIRAVLACTERNPVTLENFLTCLKDAGVVWEELVCPSPRVFHYSCDPPIRILCCSYGLQCKTRWKNVKDYYTKQKKEERNQTIGSAGTRRKAGYWDGLHFLDVTPDERSTLNNIESPVFEESVDIDDFMDVPGSYVQSNLAIAISEGETDVNLPDREDKREAELSTESKSHEKGRIESSRVEVLKSIQNQREEHHKVIELLLEKKEEDEIDLFFKTMAATTKKFSKELRRQAKIKVFNIITEFEGLHEGGF